MRYNIKKLKGFNRFVANITKKEISNGKNSYLLTNIKLYGKNKLLTDHLWIIYKNDVLNLKNFLEINKVKDQSMISFTARKTKYRKGYYGNNIVVKRRGKDFCLTDLKNIKLERDEINEKIIENLSKNSKDLDFPNIEDNLEMNNKINMEDKAKLKKYNFFLSGFESNWYRCQFKDEEGNIFNCTEQYFMYHKAKLFGDDSTANEILKTVQPRIQKSLGRKVKGFKEEIWDEHKERIMFEGNLLKYKQNSRLKKLLINTYPDILVEANPNDNIWGIGISEDHPDILDTSKWGENLMGKTLMKVREELMKK